MHTLRILFIIVSIASLITGFFLFSNETIDEKKYLHALAPGLEFSDKKGDPPRYESETGIAAFNSYDLAPEISGYAGPIKLLVALNARGEIAGVTILEHNETPNYVHYMVSSEYLKQFAGKTIHDPFEIDRDIDGISRATESVQALLKTVRTSSRAFASRVYGLTVQGDAPETFPESGWILYCLFFLVALACYFFSRQSPALVRAREVTLLAGFVIIGIYLATPFSILHVLNLLLLRTSSSPLWYTIVISTLLSLMVAGRFYCGWLCPFGAIAEYIGKLPFRKWQVSKKNDELWRKLKYVLLMLIVPVVLISRNTSYANFETYVTLFSFYGNVLGWSLVALMLIMNIRVKRFWCRYLCPVAAFTGLFSRQDERYVSRHDCPMGNSPHPHTSECIRCNRCYSR